MSIRTFWKQLASSLAGLPGKGLIILIRIYQLTFSRVIGNRCRFHPSCSAYFIDSLRKYGFFSGIVRGIWRLCRCHPFHPGGYDPA